MIGTVGIVGAGQMGSGIADLCARHGRRVLLYDRDRAATDRALAAVRRDLERHPAAAAADEVLARIVPVAELTGLAGADFVVEAAPEDGALKRQLFRQLDALVPPEVILASNTSSLAIADLAAATGRPDRVIGMHFMNPVTVMPLVEIIRGAATGDAAYDATVALAADLGKETVTSRDRPGFIVNRVLIPMINEAVYVLAEGVAAAEDIDKAMVLGTRQPMGPLALADFIGLDTVLAIAAVLYEGLGGDRYRPCPLLAELVAAGRLGRKSGHGFYLYGAAAGRERNDG